MLGAIHIELLHTIIRHDMHAMHAQETTTTTSAPYAHILVHASRHQSVPETRLPKQAAGKNGWAQLTH
jgi:hypothetical protein